MRRTLKKYLPAPQTIRDYTNPFTIVPLYLLAYQIGRLTIGESNGFITPPAFSATDFIGWTSAMQTWMLTVAQPLGIGLIMLASGLAVLGYFATRAGGRAYLINAWRRRKKLKS
mgnify:CR=1 FL=1